jgi:hypothetical protein
MALSIVPGSPGKTHDDRFGVPYRYGAASALNGNVGACSAIELKSISARMA